MSAETGDPFIAETVIWTLRAISVQSLKCTVKNLTADMKQALSLTNTALVIAVQVFIIINHYFSFTVDLSPT